MEEKNLIKIDFNDGQAINFILTSTGQKNVCVVSNNELKMMLGRIYYVPVNNKINSDYESINIKILGNIADQIDVRYIKDNLACIIPLQHNIKLSLNQEICKVINLNQEKKYTKSKTKFK